MSYHEYEAQDGRIISRHYNGRRAPEKIYFTRTIGAELAQAKRALINLMGENSYIRWAYKIPQATRDNDNQFLAEIEMKISEYGQDCTCEPGQETPCPACRIYHSKSE